MRLTLLESKAKLVAALVMRYGAFGVSGDYCT